MLDDRGVRSVVLPLVGAASNYTTAGVLNGKEQQLLRCRLINSIAGIALGIKAFVLKSKSIQEIGIVQWDQDLFKLFFNPGSGEAKSREYPLLSENVLNTMKRGLDGRATMTVIFGEKEMQSRSWDSPKGQHRVSDEVDYKSIGANRRRWVGLPGPRRGVGPSASARTTLRLQREIRSPITAPRSVRNNRSRSVDRPGRRGLPRGRSPDS